MISAITVDVKQRGSVDELLDFDFIKKAKQSELEPLGLDQTPLDETALTEHGGNMYKFYMAHCINEIVCRFKLNQDKCKIIYSLKEILSVDIGNIIGDMQTGGGPAAMSQNISI